MKYCYECDNEKDFHFVGIDRTYNVKGKGYSLAVQASFCDYCGQEIFDPDIDSAYQQQAFDLYREEHHLLKPSDFKAIREKYGLAIDRFSELIGLGKKTMWRYENGFIPDKAQNTLIRLMDNPENFRIVYEEGKGMLRPDEIARIEQALAEFKTHGVTECVIVQESAEWTPEPDNIISFEELALRTEWKKEARREYAAVL